MSYPSPAKDMAPVRMKAEFGRQLSIYVMAAWISLGGGYRAAHRKMYARK